MKLQSMDIDSAIKKIRTQIKYGRVVDAERSLHALLDPNQGTAQEVLLLAILALELCYHTGSYAKAIPLLERLLQLDIPNELRNRALGTLYVCKRKVSIVAVDACIDNLELDAFMNLIRKGHIFDFGAHPNSLRNSIFTNDIEQAQWLAWHQGIEAPFKSWNGLRAQASRQLYSHCREKGVETKSFDKSIAAEIVEVCEQKMTGEMMHFFDEVYGDLIQIAKAKLVGFESDLYKKMWRAYKKGTFPCGWKGEFPDGKLCIFVPVPAIKARSS